MQVTNLEKCVQNFAKSILISFPQSQITKLKISGPEDNQFKLPQNFSGKQLSSSCSAVEILSLQNLNINNFSNTIFLRKLTRVSLKHNRLKEFSSLLLFNITVAGNIRSLDLSNNHLKLINRKSFLKLNGLKKLRLKSNHLTYLPPDVFCDLTRLKILDLRFNRLEIISYSGSSFRGLTQLQKLLLNSNEISQLFVESSLHNVSEITSLSWHDSPSFLEAGLANLNEINLKHNKIKFLYPWVSRFAKLTKIDLSFNELETICLSYFANSSLLAHLDLSHNLITSLTRDNRNTFNRKVSKRKEEAIKTSLNLSNNYVIALESESFRYVVFFLSSRVLERIYCSRLSFLDVSRFGAFILRLGFVKAFSFRVRVVSCHHIGSVYKS